MFHTATRQFFNKSCQLYYVSFILGLLLISTQKVLCLPLIDTDYTPGQFNYSLIDEICNNGIDDDGDGLIDCEDPDCYLTNSNECVTCLGDSPSFVDAVMEYMPTCAADLHPNASEPTNAIGSPDYEIPPPGNIGNDFVSLGEGGFIRLQFVDNILVNSGDNGPDLWIFEVGTAIEASEIDLRPLDSSTENILLTQGFTDPDGDGFYYINSIGGATANLDIDFVLPGYDFGELKFDAVKITDEFQNNPCGGTSGADIDSVCALSSMLTEDCSNGIDDDGDGLVDCDDPDLFGDCCCLEAIELDLGPDISTCLGNTVILSAGVQFVSYLWSDQSSASILPVTQPGSYSVTTVDSCDNIMADTINVFFEVKENGLEEISICQGDTATVNGIDYFETGQYEQSITAPLECDSTLIIDIVVNPVYFDIETYTIDFGESVTVNGIEYTEAGHHFQNYTSSEGCDSTFLINLIVNHEIIHYDFNDCLAWSTTDNFLYDEFNADYPQPLDCNMTNATIVRRDEPLVNRHSCTPGMNGTLAMCISSLDDCQYDKTSTKSIKFEVTIDPDPDFGTQISQFAFYQKAPLTFDWINGDSGLNNYPTKFGIRILKDGQEIYYADNLATDTNWKEQVFDFSANTDLYISQTTSYQFELMAYCLIGNGSPVSAWDIENISISAFCDELNSSPRYTIGQILGSNNQPLDGINVVLSEEHTIQNNTSDIYGKFAFINTYNPSQLDVSSNKDPMDGVSTLDILLIQKHILGLKDLSSPLKLLAADVNRSGSVSAIDLVELRKLILGIYPEFPNNDSWRFIAHTNLSLHDDPYSWPEYYELTTHNNIQSLDFIGLKVGDVDFSNSTNLVGEHLSNRSSDPFNIYFENQKVLKNQIMDIPFSIKEKAELHGLQMSIEVKEMEIIDILSDGIILDDSHWHINKNNKLTISWTSNETTHCHDQTLFTIRARSFTNQEIAEALILNQEGIKAQVYTGSDLEIKNISLKTEDFITGQIECRISPNPMFSESFLLIDLISSQRNGHINIFNTNGVLLHDVEVNHEDIIRLDRNILQEKGVYYVQLVSGTDVRLSKVLVL